MSQGTEAVEFSDVSASGGGLVFLFTVALTAGYFGILALIREEAIGIGDRLPVYALVTAVVFVTMILSLERRRSVRGVTILSTATATALASSVLIFLAGEGIAYTIRFPQRVFDISLIIYLLAAALITTGIGYWILRHWREFVRTSQRV